MRRKHPADLGVAPEDGCRHLHHQAVVCEQADLLAAVERAHRVGQRGAHDQGVAVAHEGVASGLANLPGADELHIAAKEILVGIDDATGPIVTAEAGRGKDEPGLLANGLHHHLDRVDPVIQVHAPDRLRRGQVDEHVHATEQVTLDQALLGRAERGEIHGISRVEVHARRQYPRRDIGRTANHDAIDDQPGLGGRGHDGRSNPDQDGENEGSSGWRAVFLGQVRDCMQAPSPADGRSAVQ